MHTLYSTLLDEWLQLDVPWIGYAKVAEKDDDDDDDEEDDDEDIEDEDEDELDEDDSGAPDDESNDPEEGDKEKKSIWDYKWIINISAISLVIAALLLWYFVGGQSGSGAINEGPKPIQLKTSGTAVYVKFPKDEILAVLKDRNGSPHNVLMEVVLLTRDERVKVAMENNAAIIISEILELIETQNYEHLLTFSGKQRLRTLMLKHIKKMLPDYGPSIEKVLVIKFMMD
jgi:flagellar basal body-associated protein FliL